MNHADQMSHRNLGFQGSVLQGPYREAGILLFDCVIFIREEVVLSAGHLDCPYLSIYQTVETVGYHSLTCCWN